MARSQGNLAISPQDSCQVGAWATSQPHNHAQGLGKGPELSTGILGTIWLTTEIHYGCSTSGCSTSALRMAATVRNLSIPPKEGCQPQDYGCSTSGCSTSALRMPATVRNLSIPPKEGCQPPDSALLSAQSRAGAGKKPDLRT